MKRSKILKTTSCFSSLHQLAQLAPSTSTRKFKSQTVSSGRNAENNSQQGRRYQTESNKYIAQTTSENWNWNEVRGINFKYIPKNKPEGMARSGEGERVQTANNKRNSKLHSDPVQTGTRQLFVQMQSLPIPSIWLKQCRTPFLWEIIGANALHN